MSKAKKVPSTAEQWESGELGRSLDHAKVVDDEYEGMVDEAFNLRPISIRLEKHLIDAFKFIASHNKGIGYQPLMRQVLHRFAVSEIKMISQQMEEEQKKIEEEMKEAEEKSDIRKRA